jgi:2-C-methyl-D-erythritol 4-phosphate cytidylyltransferase
MNGLKALSGETGWVLIHDAARPLVARQTVRRTIRAAARTGGAIAALAVASTVKRARRDGTIAGTVDREGLYLAQTPQVFRRDLIEARFKTLGKKAAEATDDAALFDGTPLRVGLVADSARNFKITTREDLNLFRYFSAGGGR